MEFVTNLNTMQQELMDMVQASKQILTECNVDAKLVKMCSKQLDEAEGKVKTARQVSGPKVKALRALHAHNWPNDEMPSYAALKEFIEEKYQHFVAMEEKRQPNGKNVEVETAKTIDDELGQEMAVEEDEEDDEVDQEMASEEEEDDIVTSQEPFTPPVDPITKRNIVDPVRNAFCKHVYERATILKLIERKKKQNCPFIGCANKRAILKRHLKPDERLRRQIQAYDSSK